MYSTAEDLVHWIKSIFDGKVIPPEYFEQMMNFSSISNYLYGLGFMQVTGLYGKIYGHSGGIPGYASFAGYSPNADVYVAVELNQDIDPYSFVDALLKTVIDYKKTTLVQGETSLPEKFELSQNYPNPFNNGTIIRYQLLRTDFVSLIIYDVIGRKVATLVQSEKPAGNYEIEFNASALTSGVYFYRLTTGDYTLTKKMILQK
jgi:hypothetical protein